MSPLIWIVSAAIAPVLDTPIPPRCPDQEAIRAQFTNLLAAPDAQDLTITLGYAPQGDQLRVSAQVQRETERLFERSLSGVANDCDALTSSLILSVALALDDLKRVEPAPSMAWQLHAGLLGATGPLPGWGLTTEVGGGLHGARWSGGVALRFQIAGAGDVSVGAVEANLLAGAGFACGSAGDWRLCGAGIVGGQWLTGAEFAQNDDVSGVYAAGGLRLERAWPFDMWHVVAVAEGWRPFTRLYLTVSGERAWQTPAWVGTLGLMVGRSF